MRIITKLLNAMKYITWKNIEFFIQKKLHEIIVQIIHINCDNE
jgi:hypothetical protein